VSQQTAAQMSQAALAFVDSLNVDQRAIGCWAFDDSLERQRWYYTPTDHGGLALSQMSPSQQRLAYQLVATGLSTAGYVTMTTIVGLDNVLDHVEGWVRDWGRERGRDPGLYYLRIFGDPAGDEPWSWRFGGHHVSINHLVINGEVAATTPLFFGADPASSPLLGPHPLRPLEGVEDLARDLVRCLDERQKSLAIATSFAPVDIVGANRPLYGRGEGDLPMSLADVWRTRFEGELGATVDQMQESMESAAGLNPQSLEAVRLTLEPRGLPASMMTGDQVQMLRTLLDRYTHRLPDSLIADEAGKYADDAIAEVHFLWAGGIEVGQPHYYRAQSAQFMCEYDNTQRGANHVHTVWRDPQRDFGIDLLAEHHTAMH